MQFIHEPTFCKYISGNQELVVSVGIKGVIYKVTILAIIDLVVWYDCGNYPMGVLQVIDMVQELQTWLSSKQVLNCFMRKFCPQNTYVLKPNSVLS